MLAAARRRIDQAGWRNVVVLDADIEDVPAALQTAAVDTEAIVAVVATFVVSLLADESASWATVSELIRRAPDTVHLAGFGGHVHLAVGTLRP